MRACKINIAALLTIDKSHSDNGKTHILNTESFGHLIK